MTDIQLRKLDRTKVAICIRGSGPHTLLRGEASFEPVSGLGPHLRVLVDEADGSLEFIFREDDWNGTLSASQPASDFDYQITLDADRFQVGANP